MAALAPVCAISMQRHSHCHGKTMPSATRAAWFRQLASSERAGLRQPWTDKQASDANHQHLGLDCTVYRTSRVDFATDICRGMKGATFRRCGVAPAPIAIQPRPFPHAKTNTRFSLLQDKLALLDLLPSPRHFSALRCCPVNSRCRPWPTAN